MRRLGWGEVRSYLSCAPSPAGEADEASDMLFSAAAQKKRRAMLAAFTSSNVVSPHFVNESVSHSVLHILFVK